MNFRQQRTSRERLLQERSFSRQPAPLRNQIGSVSRHEQRTQIRTDYLGECQKINPASSGHDDIRKEQIDGWFGNLQDAERGFRISCCDDSITGILQYADSQFAQSLIIFSHQDRF